MIEFNFGNHGNQFPTGDVFHQFIERVEARLEQLGISLGDFHGFPHHPPLERPDAPLQALDVAQHLSPPHFPTDHHLFG